MISSCFICKHQAISKEANRLWKSFEEAALENGIPEEDIWELFIKTVYNGDYDSMFETKITEIDDYLADSIGWDYTLMPGIDY